MFFFLGAVLEFVQAIACRFDHLNIRYFFWRDDIRSFLFSYHISFWFYETLEKPSDHGRKCETQKKKKYDWRDDIFHLSYIVILVEYFNQAQKHKTGKPHFRP